MKTSTSPNILKRSWRRLRRVYARWHVFKGEFSCRPGEEEAVLGAYEKAVRLLPSDDTSWLARAYLGLGQIDAVRAEHEIIKADTSERGVSTAAMLQADIEEFKSRGGD